MLRGVDVMETLYFSPEDDKKAKGYRALGRLAVTVAGGAMLAQFAGLGMVLAEVDITGKGPMTLEQYSMGFGVLPIIAAIGIITMMITHSKWKGIAAKYTKDNRTTE